MTERCLDMHKGNMLQTGAVASGLSKTKRRKRTVKIAACPYRADEYSSFVEGAVSSLRDIEDLAHLGRELGLCPYYGSRRAMPLADVIAMPYSYLLHAKTRSSVGLDLILKDSVVIIDEAHNIVDAINSIHCARTTVKDVQSSLAQLSQYEKRYRTRLTLENLNFVRQILLLLRALQSMLCPKTDWSKGNVGKTVSGKGSRPMERIMSINDFLHAAKIDDINVLRLGKYMERSKICQKLRGFAESLIEVDGALLHLPRTDL